MSQSPYDARLGGSTPVTPPIVPPVPDAGTRPEAGPVVPPPLPVPDNSEALGALEDLRMQEEVVAEILAVIEEAGRLVGQGAPRWVDPDVFGGSGKGVRLARHTVRAQARVHDTLDRALAALAQHHGSLSGFRDDVRRVEDQTVTELTAVQNRLGETAL